MGAAFTMAYALIGMGLIIAFAGHIADAVVQSHARDRELPEE